MVARQGRSVECVYEQRSMVVRLTYWWGAESRESQRPTSGPSGG